MKYSEKKCLLRSKSLTKFLAVLIFVEILGKVGVTSPNQSHSQVVELPLDIWG
uniref:Uncharacterized protein n=1 Tax=Arion vulgaris TaxID=1028688 RepID=A0A0B7BVW8_9EUPU